LTQNFFFAKNTNLCLLKAINTKNQTLLRPHCTKEYLKRIIAVILHLSPPCVFLKMRKEFVKNLYNRLFLYFWIDSNWFDSIRNCEEFRTKGMTLNLLRFEM